MDERPLGLKELDVNISRFQFETFRKPPSNIGEVRRSDSGKNELQAAAQWLILIIDCWQASILEEGPLQGLVSIAKDQGGTSKATCVLQKELLPAVLKKNWAQLQLSEPILHEDLTLESQFSISRDRLQVTVFARSTVTLLKDIERNMDYFQQREQPSQVKNWVPESVYVHWEEKAAPINPCRISSYEILLNKNQVTYLIGKNGARIEALREISNATIKILPISKRLTERELNHPSCVNQSISVTGDRFEIAMAFAYIESHLELHRLGPRRMLL